MIVKSLVLGTGGLAAYQIGKNAEKKRKRVQEKKLNKAIKQHMNAVRHTR